MTSSWIISFPLEGFQLLSPFDLFKEWYKWKKKNPKNPKKQPKTKKPQPNKKTTKKQKNKTKQKYFHNSIQFSPCIGLIMHSVSKIRNIFCCLTYYIKPNGRWLIRAGGLVWTNFSGEKIPDSSSGFKIHSNKARFSDSFETILVVIIDML